MAVTLGRTYVTTGLICYLNAGDPNSYSGSGSTWTDLSGNGAHFTLQGNLTWTSKYGFGNFEGNGSGNGNKAYAQTASKFYNLKTSQGGAGYTVCVVARSTGGAGAWRKLIANADGENYIDLYQQAGSPYGWHQDGSGESLWVNDANVSSDTMPMPDGIWRLYSATNSNSGTTSNPSTALTLGNEPNGSGTGTNAYPWIGNIGAVLIYNRVLSQSEIRQNFRAFIIDGRANLGGGNGIVFSDGTSQGAAMPTVNKGRGDLIDVQSFTQSGTWTNPGATMVHVKMIGGGGGGCGYCESGGAGTFAEGFYDVSNTGTVSVTIGGGGGYNVYYSAAGQGGSSSFGSYLSCIGGYGANQQYSHSGGHGGNSQSGAGFWVQGGAGCGHINSAGHVPAGVLGGTGYFGSPAAHIRNHSNLGWAIQHRFAPPPPGSGGSGNVTDWGYQHHRGHSAGEYGASGLVIVYSYK